MIPLLLGTRRPRKRALLIGVGGTQARGSIDGNTGSATLALGALNSHSDVELIKNLLTGEPWTATVTTHNLTSET